MFDINEIRKRAQAASDAASRQLNESMEKSRKITEQMQEDMEAAQAAREAGQQQDAEQAAAQQRQVEILGQMFSPDVMAQMAATEEMIDLFYDRPHPRRYHRPGQPNWRQQNGQCFYCV